MDIIINSEILVCDFFIMKFFYLRLMSFFFIKSDDVYGLFMVDKF